MYLFSFKFTKKFYNKNYCFFNKDSSKLNVINQLRFNRRIKNLFQLNKNFLIRDFSGIIFQTQKLIHKILINILSIFFQFITRYWSFVFFETTISKNIKKTFAKFSKFSKIDQHYFRFRAI